MKGNDWKYIQRKHEQWKSQNAEMKDKKTTSIYNCVCQFTNWYYARQTLFNNADVKEKQWYYTAWEKIHATM